MADLDPTRMNRAQLRHLDDVRQLWPRCVEAAALQEASRGAMGWKTVGTAEYLTRYFMDPATGRKVMNSLGRRSPETEGRKADFDASRARADRFIEDLDEELVPSNKVGRALKIGHMNPAAATVIRELSLTATLGSDLFVVGDVVMHLHEARAGALLPRRLAGQGGLDLLSSEESRQEAVSALFPALHRLDRTFDLHDDADEFRNDKGFLVRLHTRSSLVRAIDGLDANERQRDTLLDMLEMRPVSDVAVARDGMPVGMVGQDARAYTLLRFALASFGGRKDDEAIDRAYAVGRLVTLHGPEPFEPEHLSAFPAFAEALDAGDREVAESEGQFLRF